ncbi:MAG: hypothetical protein JJE04_07435 [Acidobacteriia bacterium]|nr:hypothetical protein [Terriglobia bacterium]
MRLDFPMLVSRSGNLGAHPDHVSTDVLSDAELVSLAGRLTGNKSGQTPAPSNSFSLDMRFPDLVPPSDRALSREERLLGLFKVWTVISYLDPHVSLASINWETALREYIPKVEAAESGPDYYAVLRRLTALLNDSHVRVSNPAHEWKAILPLSLQPIEGKPIIVATIPSPNGEEPPVKIGDEVVAIDGKPVQETIAASEAFISGSTPGARQRDAMASLVGQRKVAFLVGQRKDTVELQLRNEEGTRTLTLKSVPPRRPAHSQPSYKVLTGNLGYMDLDNLVENEMEPALQAVAGTNGLILDMRGYPRFPIWTRLIPHLIERRSQWNLFEVPIASGPNRLLRVTSQLTAWLEPSPTEIYRKPIAVLIDEFTQSAAEHFCILLRIARRATFVGSTTAGADGDVARITLPDGGTMIFTGGRIKFPDGSPFQNIGIIPDIKVEPTVHGIRAGRDEVLEKAIGVLSSTNQR